MVMKAGHLHTSLSQKCEVPAPGITPPSQLHLSEGDKIIMENNRETHTGREWETEELAGSSSRTMWFCKPQQHQSRTADFNLCCN